MIPNEITQCCIPLQQDTKEQLIRKTGAKTLKEALTEAVMFTIKNYKKDEL